MKCPKCGDRITKADAFCPECGNKIDFEEIEKKEKKQEKPKEKVKHESRTKEIKVSKKNTVITTSIIALLIIASVVIFAVPTPYEATQQYVETLPYDAQENYSEKEPYSATETYYEEEAYQDKECTYRVAKYNSEQEMEWVNSMANIICTISNFESKAITFQYKLYTTDCEDSETDSYGPRSVTIGGGNTVRKEVLLEPGGCYGCWASPQEQVQECETVTKFKSVPKTRTVTKYRDETKYRTVTKYKDEYKERKVTKYGTLFNQWTGNVKYYYRDGE